MLRSKCYKITVSSHIASRFVFLLAETVHLPPCAHSGSSHLGSTPALNKWKSAFATNLPGLNIWSYRLHKRFNFHLRMGIVRLDKSIICKVDLLYSPLTRESISSNEKNYSNFPIKTPKLTMPHIFSLYLSNNANEDSYCISQKYCILQILESLVSIYYRQGLH